MEKVNKNKPERSITNTIEVVTPEKAAFWIETANNHNRPLSAMMVKRYAEIMRAGKWRENTPEPISFTPDGVLVDGQHRLAAVVEAGIPVRMTINRNADADDFKVIDTGKKRSTADSLAVKGVSLGTVVSCTILYYLLLRDEGICSPSRIYQKYSTEDIFEEYESDPEMWDRVASFSSSCYNKSKGLIRVQIVGSVYGYLLKVKNHPADIIERFFTEVVTAQTEINAVSMMHSRLIEFKGKTKKNVTALYIIRSLARTWNHFITGNHTTKLQVSTTDNIDFD